MIFGGSSNMGIGVAVTLRDQFSGRASAISNSMDRMYGNANRVMASNLRAVRNLSAGVATAGFLMRNPISAAVKSASSFNYVMAAVNAVTQDTKVSMKELHDQALDISRETIHTANQIADAQKFLGMAGFDTQQIYNSMRAVSYLGAATDTMIGGIGGGADIISNMMQQFNIEAAQSMRVADLLTATTTRANTNLTQLGEAVYYAGGQFAALQVPMEEVLAMAGVMAGAGYRGSFAGTAMMNMAQQLVKGLGEFRTGRQSKILQQMGLSPEEVFQMKDGIVRLLPFYEIIQNMGEKIQKGVPGAAQIEGFFQKRGMRAFVALLRDPKVGMNLESFTKFLQTESTGKAFEIAQKRIENHYGQMEILQSAWNTFRISVGEALIPVLMPLIKVLTSVANVLVKITTHPLGKWLTVAVVGIIALTTVGAGLVFIFSTIATASMTTGVTIANMGRSLVWAWNSATAAAIRYGLVQRGIGNNMKMNAAGRWIDATTGRYIKAPAAAAGGRGLLGNTLGKISGWFTRLVPTMGRLVPLLGRFASVISGPIGWLIAIVTTLVGFKNIVKGVTFALGTLLQSIFYIVDVVSTFISTWSISKAFDKANENFDRRQDTMKEYLGIGQPKKPVDLNYYKFSNDVKSKLDQAYNENIARKLGITVEQAKQRRSEGGTLVIDNTLSMDGQVIGKKVGEFDDMEISALIGEQ